MIKKVCFSGSRISDLLAQGSGKTRLSYIYELAERSIGIENNFTTKEMQHGINNELDGAQILINHLGEGCINSDGAGSQVFFPVNEYVGSTPDLFHDDWTGDVKCQYSIHGFFEQNDRLVKRYFDQIQCQMLSLKVNKGYLINYLTKPEVFGEDEYKEYPIPLKDRYYIHEIEPCERTQSDILEYSERYYPLIGVCAELMLNANDIDHDEFFYNQFVNKVRYEKLKDVDWTRTEKKVYRFQDTFYVERNVRTKV